MKNHKILLIFSIAALTVFTLFFSYIQPLTAYAQEEEYIVVSNIQELNEALGGNHKISGTTLTLKSDVDLNYKSIEIDNYQENKLTINLNGKTISKTSNSSYMFYLGHCDDSISHTDLYIKGTGMMKARNDIFRLCWDNGYENFIKPIFAGNISYSSVDGRVVYTDACVSMVISNGYFYSQNNDYVISDTAMDIEYKNDWHVEKAVVKIAGGVIDGGCKIKVKNFTMTDGIINGDAEVSCYKSTFSGGIVNGSLIVDGADPVYLNIKGNIVFNKGIYLNTNELITKISGGTILAEDNGIVCNEYDPFYSKEDYPNLKKVPTKNKLYLNGGLISVSASGGCGIFINDLYDDGWAAPLELHVNGGHIISAGNKGAYAIRSNDQTLLVIGDNVRKKDIFSGFDTFMSNN